MRSSYDQNSWLQAPRRANICPAGRLQKKKKTLNAPLQHLCCNDPVLWPTSEIYKTMCRGCSIKSCWIICYCLILLYCQCYWLPVFVLDRHQQQKKSLALAVCSYSCFLQSISKYIRIIWACFASQCTQWFTMKEYIWSDFPLSLPWGPYVI